MSAVSLRFVDRLLLDCGFSWRYYSQLVRGFGRWVMHPRQRGLRPPSVAIFSGSGLSDISSHGRIGMLS
jgi:hypothetical protein